MTNLTVKRKGSDDDDDQVSVPVQLPETIKGWGNPLLSILAAAINAPHVGQVWIRYGDGGKEERLDGGMNSWRVISRLDPGDVVLVVGAPIPLSRVVIDTFSRGAGGGVGTPLPKGEQQFTRLTDLLLKNPIPQLMQKCMVRLWNEKYPAHKWQRATRVERKTRNHTTGAIVTEQLFKSGLDYLEGAWKELPFTVTHKANSDTLEADNPTVQLAAHLKRKDLIRLVAPDGTIECPGVQVKLRGQGDPTQHTFPKGMVPKNDTATDRVGLKVLVPDATVPALPPHEATNETNMRKLLHEGLGSFDVTAVTTFVKKIKTHGLLAHSPHHAALEPLFRSLASIRDSWGHVTGAAVDDDQYREDCGKIQDWANECAKARLLDPTDAELVSSVIEQLDKQVYLVEGHKISLLTGVQGDIAKAERRMITLTQSQTETFQKLWDAVQAEGSRWLVQAPSGSGKTVICVKLAAQFLKKKKKDEAARLAELSKTFRASTESHKAPALLLLAHSEVLATQIAKELRSDLETSCPGSRPNLSPIAAGVHQITLDSSDDGACVQIAAIDAFVDLVGGVAQKNPEWTASRGRYTAVLVDEGHLVFGAQPDPELHGQHRFADDASKVREVLDHTLTAGAAMVVFHDENYQRVGGGAGVPYPTGCAKYTAALPIVRNPGSVRDLSVIFSKTLVAAALRSKGGRQGYHPLLDEGEIDAAGKPVRLVDVARAKYRSIQQRDVKLVDWLTPNMLASESAEQSKEYAVEIVSELERIRLRLASNALERTAWAGLVAVLLPGTAVSAQILEAVAELVNDDPLKHGQLAKALPPDRKPGYGPTGLYFGPVENFVGLERPLVIVTGMEHPKYLDQRARDEEWSTGKSGWHPTAEWRQTQRGCRREDERSSAQSAMRRWGQVKVDPRAYLAVTRCTLELSVVEVFVERHAAHFGMSSAPQHKVNKARAATRVGSSYQNLSTSNAIVEALPPDKDGLCYIRVLVDIDFTQPPEPEDLVTAGVLSLKSIGQQLWDGTTFRWAQCKTGILELELHKDAFAIEVRGEAADLLQKLIDPLELPHLQKLWLDDIPIKRIPNSIGDFKTLTQLYVEHTEMVTLPDSVGNLTAMETLHLKSNKLEALPDNIGNLTALRVLNLADNLLSSIPDSIGCLVALQNLNLSGNQLRNLPAGVGDLAALESLRLQRNRLNGDGLRSVAFGNLKALEGLRLDVNNIDDLPVALLRLEGLVSLNLSKNWELGRWPTMGLEAPWPKLGRLVLYDCPKLMVDQSIPKVLKPFLDRGVEIEHIHRSDIKQLPLDDNFVKELAEQRDREFGSFEKWLPGRGFGFIQPDCDGAGRGVFCHIKDVLCNKDELQVGTRVTFRRSTNDRGPCAIEVVPDNVPGMPRPPHLPVSSFHGKGRGKGLGQRRGRDGGDWAQAKRGGGGGGNYSGGGGGGRQGDWRQGSGGDQGNARGGRQGESRGWSGSTGHR